MRAGDFIAKEFAGTSAGLTDAITYCGSNGVITLYPGNSSITIPSLVAKPGIRIIKHEAGFATEYGQGGLTRPFLNVRDYGAVGDGATNDATKLQAAIDAASAAGGGMVFFPPGTYLVTVVVNIASNVRLVGCGKASIVKCTTASVDALKARLVNNVQISDLNVENSAGAGDCVRIIECDDVLIDNVHTSGGSFGIRVETVASSGPTSDRVRVTHCSASGAAQSGILLYRCTDSTVENCICYSNGTTISHHGIYVSHPDATRCEVVNCVCYSNAGGGLQMDGSRHSVIGGRFYSNTVGIYTWSNDPGPPHTTYEGCLCYLNTEYGIFCKFTDHTSFNGVQCVGNGFDGLYMAESQYVGITGGRFSDNTRNGIHLNGGTAGQLVRGCSISGAIVTDNDSANASTYSGINLAVASGAIDRCSVVGCVSRSTAGTTKQIYGVLVGTGVTKTIVVGSQLYQNKTASLQDNGTNTVTAGNQTT
jgi:parallel beta-helix repeat protein